MNHVWIAFASALAASYLFTWCARAVAPALGLVDCPDGERKLHSRPMPLMGGVAVFASLAAVSGIAVLGGVMFSVPRAVWGILLGAACFLLLGLWDDFRPLRARHKLAGQVLATVPFVMICGSIEEITVFGLAWQPGALAIPFTIFWLVSCVNIVNLLDGHDGLASSIGLIAMSSLAALTWMSGNSELAAFCLVAVGAIAGFLIHNWPPAKIFLGDAGSMTIGFLVGAISMVASLKSAATFTLVTPIAVLCVPIFDTVMAILRRQLSGRSIGTADRGHIHHRLQDSGFGRIQTLLMISGLCLTTAVAALVASWLQRDSVSAVMCVSLLLLVIASGLFGDREMVLILRHVWAVSTLVPGAGHAYSSRLLLARLQDPDSTEREQVVNAMRQRFLNAGGSTARMVAVRSDDQTHTLPIPERQDEDASPAHDASWRFTYQVIRQDGYCVALTIGGQSHRGLGGQRLEDVLRMLDAACRHWKIDDLYDLVAVLSGDSVDQVETLPESLLPQSAGQSRAA